jgi:NADH-quinone oxidoreductase subunit E
VKKPATGQQEKTTTTASSNDSTRAPFADAFAMNPLLAQSAAAMAAATAVGMSMAGQFAGAFFGALQGAMETQKRFGAAVGPDPKGETSKPPAVQEDVVVSKAAPVAELKAKRKPASAEPSAEAPTRTVKAGAPKQAASRPVRKKAVEDLKQISGIGPKLEKVLNARGVTRVSQIADWSEKDVASFDAALGLDGRIGRDNWVGQAKKLAK